MKMNEDEMADYILGSLLVEWRTLVAMEHAGAMISALIRDGAETRTLYEGGIDTIADAYGKMMLERVNRICVAVMLKAREEIDSGRPNIYD